jgi:excisionase family DNA binding protein
MLCDTVTVAEAAASLGISRASAYRAAGRGELGAIRIGRRLVIPRAALKRLLEPSED